MLLLKEDIERISNILEVNEKDIAIMEERMNAPDKSVDTVTDPITEESHKAYTTTSQIRMILCSCFKI